MVLPIIRFCQKAGCVGPVIADLEKLTGVAVRRIHGDKGYRGHNYPNRFRVWISGQVRRVTKVIRREMRRRAAVEPVIGHLKDDHDLFNSVFGRIRMRCDPLNEAPVLKALQRCVAASVPRKVLEPVGRNKKPQPEGGGAKVGPTRGIDIQGRMLGGGQSLMFPLSRVHDCQSGEDQHSQQGSGEGYPVSPFGG